MDAFFYAKVDEYEVQVYSDSEDHMRSEAVVYLSLVDEAYPRAELWFVDRYESDVPDNELVISGARGTSAFKAFFRLEKMDLILEILRAHDSVWFTWDDSRVAAIRAGREPLVGEGSDD